MNTKQPPTNLGLSWVNRVIVFPAHFNPNNSLLILLQISLLFMCTPALTVEVKQRFQIPLASYEGALER